MKRILLCLGLIMLYISGLSQSSTVKKCYTYESLQDFRLKNPKAETDAQFEKWLTTQKNKLSTQRLASTYTIPIIFHIIHNGDAVGSGENLSAAQIRHQLDQLNTDFANASGSRYGVAANMDIQFCLATVDPNGNVLPEPGINRINSTTKGWTAPPYDASSSSSYVDVTIMPNSIWDPYKYFNIWVLDIAPLPDGNTLLGKATWPASSTLSGLGSNETDTHAGVIVNFKSVGSVAQPATFGTSAGLGRTLTHEIGHSFGLRHISGDSNCGDDFCADTPPQNGQTFGCPSVGTLNGCSPSVAKMFENYMDYTDDLCVNTFTADQKSRMFAVMLNSPRRKELTASGTCNAVASNAIEFSRIGEYATETGTTGTCPRYKDVSLNINVFSAATGDATVTFTTSGTATNGSDYDIIPASLTYTNGESGSKQVTIRIYDDVGVESTETLFLSYTISGTGVVAGATAQTYKLNITDNDITPVISNNAVTLLNENFGTSGGSLPSGWNKGSIANPAGANTWVVSSNGGAGVTGQSAHITSDATAKPNTYSLTSTSDVLLITRRVVTTGYTNLTLSFRYKAEGEYTSTSVSDYGLVMYSTDGSSFSVLTDADGYAYILAADPAMYAYIDIPLPAALNNSAAYIGFRWINNNNGIGTNPGLTIDDVVIKGDATKVESSVNATSSQQVPASQEIYLRSTDDGQAIARIASSSANIACLTATVTQAGNGAPSISTANGTYLRTQKVIQLTPSTSNSATTYTATLYFSTEELDIWGGDKLNLKILKVKDGVNLSSTIASADAVLVTPTSVVEDAAKGFITYTANFTGFSQFMLVSPAFTLPARLSQFTVLPELRTIRLNWKAETERGFKGYEVQRSTDKVHFTKIGWVEGSGGRIEHPAYQYTDHYVQYGTTYYYRLKQVDEDGQVEYSEVKSARIEGTGVVVSIIPNPAEDFINLFVSGVTSRVDAQLMNVQGQVVRSWKNLDAFTSVSRLPVKGLPGGIYSLILHLPQGKKVIKVMVQ